jgi:radical SAM superfamily enzyme with C-terminal helix-hairpin-helix motif
MNSINLKDTKLAYKCQLQVYSLITNYLKRNKKRTFVDATMIFHPSTTIKIDNKKTKKEIKKNPIIIANI